MSKPLVAIDLDGTLIHERHWPELGPLKPGAKKAVLTLLKTCDVTLFSARINERDLDGKLRSKEEQENEIKAIRKLLDDNGLHEVTIHLTKGKPSAILFVDDRAVRFDGSWERAYKECMARGGFKT